MFPLADQTGTIDHSRMDFGEVLTPPPPSLLFSGFQLPLPEEIHWSPGDSKLHDMSAEEVANQLVTFDWELFSCVHEVGFHRRGPGIDRTAQMGWGGSANCIIEWVLFFSIMADVAWIEFGLGAGTN